MEEGILQPKKFIPCDFVHQVVEEKAKSPETLEYVYDLVRPEGREGGRDSVRVCVYICLCACVSV